MEKIAVQDLLRKKKRELNAALGDDILRYIAELLTNADDSYKRLESSFLVPKDLEKVIYIEVKEDAKNADNFNILVTDNAETLEKEYNRGCEDTTKELTKDYNYSTELLKKDYDSVIERQKDKIASLEELKKGDAMITSLQGKLDKAYAEIKDMATRTVEANGGVKILSNNREVENK